jgi:MFS family permease
VIIAGTFLAVICMSINLAGVNLLNFWLALLVLGVGWNFMFIGGTTLLTEAARPEERAKVQAANDFLVFTMVAAASFSSGALEHMVGWQAVNAAVALPMLIAFAGAAWLLRARRQGAQAA